jgi:hypothetical protein
MAREAHPQRTEAIRAIIEHEAALGPTEGARAARKLFPAIGDPTWKSWIKAARRPAPAPAPSPSMTLPAARASGSLGGDAVPLTFEERIAMMDRHVALIVAQCTTEVVDPATGARTTKARNPVVLAQAVRLQAQAAELLVKYAQAAWNQGRMEELYQQVIDAIGEVDRGMQQAVLKRLRGLNERRGGAVKFGLGVTPATELADF